MEVFFITFKFDDIIHTAEVIGTGDIYTVNPVNVAFKEQYGTLIFTAMDNDFDWWNKERTDENYARIVCEALKANRKKD